MTTCLSLTQNTNSNNKTDNETTVSSLEEEILDKELSQQLTQKTDFQKEFWRPTDKKKHPNSMSHEESRDAYNKADSISELTCFLWKRVEEHERVNGFFKHKGDMHG